MFDKLREFVRPFYLRNIYFPLFPGRKPPYFDAAWRFPALDPEPQPDKPVILFLPMNDWHTRIQRTQHLARALSVRGFRCVYLNPHLGREFPGGLTGSESVRVTRLDTDLFELHIHLPREPVFHHRLLTASESARIAHAVTGLLEKLGSPPVCQIMALPVWLDVALLLRSDLRAPIIYDCHDYLPGFAGIAQPIVDREPAVFQASDVVLCSSANLIDRCRAFTNAPAVLLRNAASSELLRIPRAPAPQVTIGYIGALDSWFDTESVRAAAVAHPEWRFQLIGRVENEGVGALRHLANIEFPGEIPFAQLAPFLAAFHAGIVPFFVNPLIAATDPIKVYEYLAAGLPVVCADLPEVARFGDQVARYRNAAGFIQALETAIATDSPALTAARRATAARETWDERADALAARIASLIAARI